jgi:hypothetical protein
MSRSGRVEPTRRSDSAPETCHPPAIPDWNFERVGKDRLWPISEVDGLLPARADGARAGQRAAWESGNLETLRPSRHFHRAALRAFGATKLDKWIPRQCAATSPKRYKVLGVEGLRSTEEIASPARCAVG